MGQRQPINKGTDITRPVRGEARDNTRQINVRLDKDELGLIDAWIASSGPPFVSRPEAIRRLLRETFDG
jgi:hypothetical protein